MPKRAKLTRKASRKNFRKGTRVKSRNIPTNPMRGGIRL